jgi:hypothetical protein
MGTYEMIKALPGKTTNWSALVSGLREMHGLEFYEELEILSTRKGIRNQRDTAMRMAVEIILTRVQTSRFIPPSPETLSWGGFLGGETVVLRDRDLEEKLTDEIRGLIKRVA